MRRFFGLALAVGLLPAASGGAACVAHWVGGGELHAQAARHASSEQVTRPTSAHDAHAAHGHAAHAHMTTAHDAPSAPASGVPMSHDADAPCTALAACGVLAAVEAPARPLPPATPTVSVRSGEQLAPPGPSTAPDVPPPRR